MLCYFVYRSTFAGVSVSNSTFNSLVQRYSHRDGKIYFDDYIHCIARLCTMFGMQKSPFVIVGENITQTLDLERRASSEKRCCSLRSFEREFRKLFAHKFTHEWMNDKNLYSAMIRNAQAFGGKNVLHDAMKRVIFSRISSDVSLIPTGCAPPKEKK